MHPVNELLDAFLRTAKGSSPDVIKARILHLQNVYLNPEAHSKDTSSLGLREKRRGARQSLLRLQRRYPEVANATMQEAQASEVSA
jgi:hypothetical protein